MNALVDELKVRARLRLNAGRRDAAADREGGPRLRDCLHEVSREVGFEHWEHARRVLGGLSAPGEDMGTFWHSPRTASLLNTWCATLAQAQDAHARQRGSFLLPYRRQFVVVREEFVRELGLEPRDAAWDGCGRDLVSGYGGPSWLALARVRLRAPRSSFDGR